MDVIQLFMLLIFYSKTLLFPIFLLASGELLLRVIHAQCPMSVPWN